MGNHDTEAFAVEVDGDIVHLRIGDTHQSLPREIAEQFGYAIADTLRDTCLYVQRRITLTSNEVMAFEALSLHPRHGFRGCGRQVVLNVPATALEFYTTAGDPKARMAQALAEDVDSKFAVWYETCVPPQERGPPYA